MTNKNMTAETGEVDLRIWRISFRPIIYHCMTLTAEIIWVSFSPASVVKQVRVIIEDGKAEKTRDIEPQSKTRRNRA
jgi:hypothetical protein